MSDAFDEWLDRKDRFEVKKPFRVECICVSCRRKTMQWSIDEADRNRKTPKSWACGCSVPPFAGLSSADHDAIRTRIQAIIHRTMMSAPYPGGYRDSQVRVAADEIIELGGTALSSKNEIGGAA